MKRGFTIIEMLVVFAIFGIILSLAIPLFVKNKKPLAVEEQAQVAAAKAQEVVDENLKKRFVQSHDIAGPGLCTWHIKDVATGKEYLVVSNGSALTTIDVTPANVQIKKPEKE